MKLVLVIVTGLVTACSSLPRSMTPEQFNQQIAQGQYQSITERTRQSRELRVYHWGTPTPTTIRP